MAIIKINWERLNNGHFLHGVGPRSTGDDNAMIDVQVDR